MPKFFRLHVRLPVYVCVKPCLADYHSKCWLCTSGVYIVIECCVYRDTLQTDKVVWYSVYAYQLRWMLWHIIFDTTNRSYEHLELCVALVKRFHVVR